MSDQTLPTAPVGTGPEGSVPQAPGGTLGRFVLLGSLGVGGMGVVLKAFDPHLDRAVAIKILRPDTAPGAGREARDRLRREAQSMAKITHPNVVSVFEVGEVNDQIFVVMECVEGQTLKRWLAAEPRTVKAILDMAIGAGRGLEAAHAAGLVHRDVKPSNVLVGKDDRPRVGDFGIAQARSVTDEGHAGGAPVSGRGGADSRAGTVGYMAPEHLAGEALDARADQFSFCAMVFEALHGELPFSGDSFADYRAAVLGGQPRKPKRRDVPTRIDDILLRGIDRDPDARWPSMTALLAALGRDPKAARRRLTTAGIVLAAAAVTVGSLYRARAHEAPECASGESLFTSVWDGPRKQAIEKAFADTKVPYATETFGLVRGQIDSYTSAWSAMHDEACRATRVEGRQSDSLLDLRMACLERGRKKLGFITAEWAAASPKTVAQASDMAHSLPAIAGCADVTELTLAAPIPQDPAAKAKILDLRTRLDAASVKLEADPTSGIEAEAALLSEANATGYAPLMAEVQYEYGTTLRRRSLPDAVEMLKSAAKSAALAHDDALAARAFASLGRALAGEEGQLQQALPMVLAAEAFVARAGSAPSLRVEVLGARGRVLQQLGQHDLARAAHEEAYRVLKENKLEGGADILNNLAIVASLQGRAEAAQSYSESAVRGVEALYGANHPALAQAVNTLGYVFASMGDYGSAEPLFLRSLAIAEKSLPLDAPDALIMRTNVACIRLGRGHFEEAAALFDQTLRLCDGAGRGDGLEASEALANFAELRRALGRLAEAELLVARSLAIREKRLPPGHPDFVLPLHVLAHIRMDQGKLPQAEAILRRALAVAKAGGEEATPYLEARIREAELLRMQNKAPQAQALLAASFEPLEKAAGKGHPLVAEAAIQWAKSDPDLASHVARLSRAAELCASRGLAPSSLGGARAWLARALLVAGDKPRALATADLAEKDLALAPTEPAAVKELEELRAWRRKIP